MTTPVSKEKTTCFHCGEDCKGAPIWHEDRSFCCFGCQTVFELLNEKDLCDYYSFETNPGNQLSHFIQDKYVFLDEEEIVTHLLDFQSDSLNKITFSIPSIHCSSCIWLLENIRRFDEGILRSKINFSKKKLMVDYDPENTSLRKVAELLYQLSYEPEISLDQSDKNLSGSGNHSYLKIGIAGFCFGNIMLLAFPDYLGIELDSEFTNYFTHISLLLSLPVLLYCSSEFFFSAFGGLRKKHMNIDLPIAIGILALFGRSLYEIISETGAGYLDSMAALVFFLLIGRWLQSKTYEGLSFDRNFKSYFPLAVQKVNGSSRQSILVSKLEINDQIEIRNNEIIPCDAILMSKEAFIDYSFVSGESAANHISEGAKIYAGGRVKGTSVIITVIKPVSQSYLTQLWNHDSFDKSGNEKSTPLIDQISAYFTPIVLGIALLAGVYWYVVDSTKVLFVISSVLIIACPCALALATPFTLSATMNAMGIHKMYLKSTSVIEKIWQIKRIVFDKTGTITTGHNNDIEWHGTPLSGQDMLCIKTLCGQSVHPLSQQIFEHIKGNVADKVTQFEEVKNKGLSGQVNGKSVKIGSSSFIGLPTKNEGGSIVAVSIANDNKGYFRIKNQYRRHLSAMVEQLQDKYQLAVLSGDNSSEHDNLKKYFPKGTPILFDQRPEDKLLSIQQYEDKERTMMIGDGLNDAGALKAGFLGISVADNMSSFTPASDIILMGEQLTRLPQFLALANQSKKIIHLGFVVSFLYNAIGLSMAVAGHITPVVAAILMPLSSISVVLLSTLGVKLISHNLKLSI